MNKGFTLIEVIIYIALFTILMGGAFVTAYQLIDGTNRIKVNTTIQEEGNFVMRKLDWIFSNLSTTTPPSIGGSLPCSQTITLYKINFSSNPIVLRLVSTTLEVSQGGGAYVPLTTVNVKATCLKFRNIPAIGGAPTGITSTTTINGIDFSVTKYIRK